MSDILQYVNYGSTEWYKYLLNIISTLKQTLYIDTKPTTQTGYEKLLQTLCKLQIKRLGL